VEKTRARAHTANAEKGSVKMRAGARTANAEARSVKNRGWGSHLTLECQKRLTEGKRVKTYAI